MANIATTPWKSLNIVAIVNCIEVDVEFLPPHSIVRDIEWKEEEETLHFHEIVISVWLWAKTHLHIVLWNVSRRIHVFVIAKGDHLKWSHFNVNMIEALPLCTYNYFTFFPDIYNNACTMRTFICVRACKNNINDPYEIICIFRNISIEGKHFSRVFSWFSMAFSHANARFAFNRTRFRRIQPECDFIKRLDVNRMRAKTGVHKKKLVVKLAHPLLLTIIASEW